MSNSAILHSIYGCDLTIHEVVHYHCALLYDITLFICKKKSKSILKKFVERTVPSLIIIKIKALGIT